MKVWILGRREGGISFGDQVTRCANSMVAKYLTKRETELVLVMITHISFKDCAGMRAVYLTEPLSITHG